MEKGMISGELFKLLACPVCKANLKYSKNNKKLACTVCKAEFSVKDGIPEMSVKKK